MAWYVLYTSARAEKKVNNRLVELGVETYLPLHRQKKRWSDRVKIVESPLFSSYVFVKCNEHVLRSLLQVYGVARIVFYLGRPAEVREEEIEAIKEFLELAHEKEIVIEGSDAEILVGPFAGRGGKVLNIERDRATLLLDELEVKICVSLQEINRVKRD